MSKSPDSDERKGDSRLDKFLRRAAPIIAAERGLTPSAKVKLQAIADEMQLPSELLEQGWDRLQSAPGERARYSRWERGFARYLADKLKKLDKGILPSDAEQRALKVATERFQLSAPQAREILVEVLEKLGVRRISQSEAERHVEAVVKELVGRSAWIDVERRERLLAIGKEWGIGSDHVTAVVDLYCRRNKEESNRQKRRSSTFVVLVSLAVMSTLAGGVWYAYNFVLVSRDPKIDDTSVDSRDSDRFAPAVWWDRQLQLSVASVVAKQPELRAPIAQLTNEDPEVRKRGYAALLVRRDEQFDQPPSRDRIESLLVACLALEPDDATFDDAVSNLAASAKLPDEGLPSSGRFYERAMASIGLLANTAGYKGIAAARTRTLRSRMEDTTGVFLGSAPPSRDDAARYQEGYLQFAFDHLIFKVAANQVEATTRFSELVSLAESRTSERRRLQWSTEFLVELLRNSPDAWGSQSDLISRCCAQANRDHVPAFLEFLESDRAPDLSKFLASELKDSFALEPDSDDPLEVAAALRRELGLSGGSPARASTLWRRLAERSKPNFTPLSVAEDPDGPLRLFRATYWGTAAMRLAVRPEQTTIVSEQLAQEELSWAEDETSVAARPGERDFADQLAPLTTLKSANSSTVTGIIRRLSAETERGRLLTGNPREAEVLAKFLLARRRASDQRQIETLARELSQWNHLLLAIADQLDQPGTAMDQAAGITESLTGVELALDPSRIDSERLRIRLLTTVADRLSFIVASDAESEWPKLQAAMDEQYRQRLRILGAGSTGGARASTSDLAAAVVDAWVRWAQDSHPEFADHPTTKDYLFRRRALSFGAGDDIERTVGIQMQWIELTSAYLETVDERRSSRIQELKAEYLRDTATRSSSIEQILDGERTLFELWRLFR